MNMMRLLSAGKSLAGGRKADKEYQLPKPGTMPTFGAKEKKKAGKEEASSNGETVKTVRGMSASAHTPLKQGVNEKPPQLTRSWLGNFLGLFSRTAAPKRSAIPSFSAVPVQGELSLENVKVMRNDLSDTDFEVVAKPAKPVPAEKRKAEANSQPAPAAAAPEPARPGNRERIWNRVTTLLGAGQS